MQEILNYNHSDRQTFLSLIYCECSVILRISLSHGSLLLIMEASESALGRHGQETMEELIL